MARPRPRSTLEERPGVAEGEIHVTFGIAVDHRAIAGDEQRAGIASTTPATPSATQIRITARP
jgi:hypothetical protein